MRNAKHLPVRGRGGVAGPEAKPEGKEPVTFLKALGTCQSPPPPCLPLSQGSGALSTHPTELTQPRPREVQWGRHSTEGEGPGRHGHKQVSVVAEEEEIKERLAGKMAGGRAPIPPKPRCPL